MFDFDRSKIVILTCGAGMSGGELAGILRRRYKIETEMAAPAYVLALTGIGDREGNLRALAEALEEIDRECSPAKGGFDLPEFALPEKVMTAAQADACEKTEVSFEEAAGQISGEYVMAYPPGVPVVVPGERITKQAIALVRKYESCGIRVKSTFCGLPEKVLVIKT
jgi:arginine/lysine/ornithine decarboxylase